MPHAGCAFRQGGFQTSVPSTPEPPRLGVDSGCHVGVAAGCGGGTREVATGTVETLAGAAEPDADGVAVAAEAVAVGDAATKDDAEWTDRPQAASRTSDTTQRATNGLRVTSSLTTLAP